MDVIGLDVDILIPAALENEITADNANDVKAKIISEGFIIHYNFLRPHMTLKGKTPAVVVGLNLPFKTWIELVEYLGRNGGTA